MKVFFITFNGIRIYVQAPLLRTFLISYYFLQDLKNILPSVMKIISGFFAQIFHYLDELKVVFVAGKILLHRGTDPLGEGSKI